MDKNELNKKKARKKQAISEALLKTVTGGVLKDPPSNFICTFDPNPSLDPLEPVGP